MLIDIGIQVEADFDPSNNASLDGIRFPGQSQNLLQYMSAEEIEQARQAAMYKYEQGLLNEAAAIAERREMRGDFRREQSKDAMHEMLIDHARAAHQAIFGGAK